MATIGAMTSPHSPEHSLAALVDAARAFRWAVEARGGHGASPEYLALQQEALRELSAAWYRLAAGVAAPHGDLSREQEVKLIGALHDVAAAFARCARACREGEATVAPVIARRRPADPGDAASPDSDTRPRRRRAQRHLPHSAAPL
jgi:hypothetical protein